jgi:hypothetical protein
MWDALTESTHRTKISASSNLSRFYIESLVRHLRDKSGPRVQASRVPYNHDYSGALWETLYFREWLLYSRDDYYTLRY